MADENKSTDIKSTPDAGKVAKRGILPKARPVMPEIEDSDERIIRKHNPGAALPRPDENDPDILAAQAEVRAAEEKLAKITQDKIILKAVEQGEHLDPKCVEELCEAEPWKKGNLTELSKNHFGFIPEKFEMFAELHPKGSEEHIKYMAARDEARKIYWDQLKNDTEKAARQLDRIKDQQERRAAYEAVNTKLWQYSEKLKQDRLYGNQAARIFWAAEAGMRRHFEKNSKPSSWHKLDVTQYKMTVSEPDGADIPSSPQNTDPSAPINDQDKTASQSLITPEPPAPD